MKEKKKKKKIIYYADDGRTLYNMDGVGGARHREKDDETHLSRKEKRAAIRAAFETYFPMLLLVIVSFSLVAVLLYFWLR